MKWSDHAPCVDLRAATAAFCVVLVWSTSFSFARDAVQQMGPWTFRFYSTLAGVMTVLPYVRRSWMEILQLQGATRKRVLWAVTINGTIVSSLNILALAYYPATTVLTLMYTMPAFAGAIEAVRLGRWSWGGVLATGAALSGVLLYVGGAPRGGALLIVLNAALWAVGTLLSARTGQPCRPSTLVTVQMIIAFLCSIPLLVLAGGQGESLPPWQGHGNVLALLYVGVLNGPVVFGLWYVAIQGLGPVRAASVTLCVPVVGALAAVLAFGETLDWWQAAGIGLVVLGMALRLRGVAAPAKGATR